MRRSNGEGSISYNESRKRYEYKITYKNENGDSKRKLFTSTKTAKEAKAKAKAFLETLENKADVEATMTLGAWLVKWLNEYQLNSIKIKTYERYQSLINKNILPYAISNISLQNLSSVELQRHFNALLINGGMNQQGLAPRSVNATRRLLIAALNVAIDSGLIEKNPADKTKALKTDLPEIHVLSHEEGHKLINTALRYGRPAWLVIVLALGTGMRISEIYGMEWDNVDLAGKQLRVDKIVVTTAKGIHIQNSAKTRSSRRTIPLPDFVCAALKRYRLWQKVQDLRHGSNYQQYNWVLANAEGQPRSPNSFSAHQYKEILKEAGLSRSVRIHDLRHTHATWLLEAGINVKVVSERLGHSSCRITLDTYSHVMRTMQEQAVEALNVIM